MGTIALKLLLVALYAWLYQAGGRAKTPGGKAVRRWLGAGVMVLSLYLLADELNLFRGIVIPLFFLTSILGYGGKKIEHKIVRRFFFGSVYAIYSILLGFAFNNFSMGAIQAFLAIFVSLTFGVINPDKAADEESVIGLLSVCLLPLIVA